MSAIELNEPISIGDVKIRNRVFLAPMSGVSDLPFRKLAWEAGAGLVISEMIASAELCSRHAESMKRLRGDGLQTHVVQLAGREAHWMGEAAKIAAGEGANIIDINMGCPAKKVTGGYSGSALMRDLDHALTLIEATVQAVDIPVTLKMRLGWDENSINAPELAARAVDAGVQMITVHGRTRCQFYKGKADWRAIRAVRESVTVPLIANGDVVTRKDALEICRCSGADAVMIGRASYGQPWLAGFVALDSNAVLPRDLSEYIIAHYEAMLDHYGERVGVRHARKHLGWYLEQHLDQPISDEQKKQLMTSSNSSEVIQILADVFSEIVVKDNHKSLLDHAA